MLADMKSIIGGVDNVSIFQYAILLEATHGLVYNFVNCLQRTQALSVVMIVRIYVRIILYREFLYPVGTRRLKSEVSIGATFFDRKIWAYFMLVDETYSKAE